MSRFWIPLPGGILGSGTKNAQSAIINLQFRHPHSAGGFPKGMPSAREPARKNKGNSKSRESSLA
jgi:hypothetical protein